MDNEANGLADWFLARHTTDPVLRYQLLSSCETSTSHRPTGRVTENALPRLALLPLCISNCHVESLGSTNNSPLAEVQGIARATAKLHRVMEEEAKQEREKMETVEREAREMVLASSSPQQQESISGLGKKITGNITCGNCGEQKYNLPYKPCAGVGHLRVEASRWPRQREAVIGPWCACRVEGEETAKEEQDFEALPEPQQET